MNILLADSTSPVLPPLITTIGVILAVVAATQISAGVHANSFTEKSVPTNPEYRNNGSVTILNTNAPPTLIEKKVGEVIPEVDKEEEKQIDLEKPKIACAPGFTVYFEKNLELSSNIDEKLEDLSTWLKSHPKLKAEIRGHADDVGSEVYNMTLSHKRAKTIAKKIKKYGTPSTQLRIQAFGEYLPSGDEKVNLRRVVVQVEGHPNCLKEDL